MRVTVPTAPKHADFPALDGAGEAGRDPIISQDVENRLPYPDQRYDA
jgi:hypothetical protein